MMKANTYSLENNSDAKDKQTARGRKRPRPLGVYLVAEVFSIEHS